MSGEPAEQSETHYPFGEPQVARDQDGRAVVLMPLRNSERCAKVLLEDWNRLADLGVSATWFCANRTHPYVHAGGYKRGEHVNLTRLIAEAKRNEVVRYADGDPLNLRRDNFVIGIQHHWSRFPSTS